MKTYGKTMWMAIILAVLLCVNVFAAESGKFTVDRTTKGDWVGNYGSDGYFLFASSEEACTDKLPDYVSEFTYATIMGDPANYHEWWNGTADDTSGIVAANDFDDAIWTDETKTARYIPAIYSGDGITLTMDVGDTETNVSVYSCDWGNDGRCVEVVLYDADGNAVDTFDLTEFEHGAYLTATVTGKIVIEYTYYDAVNFAGASNAVVSAVFFDRAEAAQAEVPASEPAANETTPAETVPAETTAPETTPVDDATETAPQTADTAIMIALAGIISVTIAIKVKKAQGQ